MASGPITSWQIEGEKVEAVPDFLFLGSKITGDSDCSHEIKRRLLLGRKVMTNLDSLIKSRDITLLTKVLIMKAMVSPVVMYRCESWTIKKAEQWRIDAFKLWCWRRLLKVPWMVKRSNQPILKEINPKYSLEGLMLKLQYFGSPMQEPTHWKRPWSWERLKATGEGGGRGWELDSIMESVDMNLKKLLEIVKDSRAWHAAVHRVSKRWTWLSDWATTTTMLRSRNARLYSICCEIKLTFYGKRTKFNHKTSSLPFDLLSPFCACLLFSH